MIDQETAKPKRVLAFKYNALGKPVEIEMEQVVVNLISNAVDSMRDSSVRTLVLRTELQKGFVELTVHDSGPGVSESLREKIFEPFFRLPGASERSGSVGLGLALVKAIAIRHQGSVSCLAREGGGACFEVRLPKLN
jgi:signal transduction histidine kinase